MQDENDVVYRLTSYTLDDLSEGVVRQMTEKDLNIIIYGGPINAARVLAEYRLQKRWYELHDPQVMQSVKDELRRIIYDIHPDEVPWFPEVTKRARVMIMAEYRKGELPDLQKSSVRAKGESFWRYTPNLGRKTLASISSAVGGFDDPDR